MRLLMAIVMSFLIGLFTSAFAQDTGVLTPLGPDWKPNFKMVDATDAFLGQCLAQAAAADVGFIQKMGGVYYESIMIPCMDYFHCTFGGSEGDNFFKRFTCPATPEGMAHFLKEQNRERMAIVDYNCAVLMGWSDCTFQRERSNSSMRPGGFGLRIIPWTFKMEGPPPTTCHALWVDVPFSPARYERTICSPTSAADCAIAADALNLVNDKECRPVASPTPSPTTDQTPAEDRGCYWMWIYNGPGSMNVPQERFCSPRARQRCNDRADAKNKEWENYSGLHPSYSCEAD